MFQQLTGIRFLRYGYLRKVGLTASLLIILSIGFTAYISLVPGAILGWTNILCSKDCVALHQVAMDTYINYICVDHRTPVPCYCGQPMNVALPLYAKTTELPFDPLHITADMPYRLKGVATHLGLAIIVLTLSGKALELGVI